MFFEEMEEIDRATAIDRPFAKSIRARGNERAQRYSKSEVERKLDNPTLGMARSDAAGIPGQGLWWERGPRWEKRKKRAVAS